MAFATGGLDGYAVSDMGDTSRDDAFRAQVAPRGAVDGGAVFTSFLAAAFCLNRGLGADELGSGVGKEALRPEDFALAFLARLVVRLAVWVLVLVLSLTAGSGIGSSAGTGPSSPPVGFSLISGNGSTRFGGSTWLSVTSSVKSRGINVCVCGALVGRASCSKAVD